jgi:phage terminase Nu1 subunit (DNA packaging protein)
MRAAREAGELVPVRDVEILYGTRVVSARTRLLSIPSRAKQRLPHLSPSDLAVLDELIREALEELSGSREPYES